MPDTGMWWLTGDVVAHRVVVVVPGSNPAPLTVSYTGPGNMTANYKTNLRLGGVPAWVKKQYKKNLPSFWIKRFFRPTSHVFIGILLFICYLNEQSLLFTAYLTWSNFLPLCCRETIPRLGAWAAIPTWQRSTASTGSDEASSYPQHKTCKLKEPQKPEYSTIGQVRGYGNKSAIFQLLYTVRNLSWIFRKISMKIWTNSIYVRSLCFDNTTTDSTLQNLYTVPKDSENFGTNDYGAAWALVVSNESFRYW
jgi:hypothetical protein